MRIIAVSTALLVLATSTLAAQAPVEIRNARQGFWIGLGLGAGSLGSDCSDCATGRTTAPSGYVRLGGTISQRVLLGVETGGWVRSAHDMTSTMEAVSAVVLWYPERTGAFYLKGGLGSILYFVSDFWRPSAPVAVADVFFPLFGKGDRYARAASGSLGVGYEFRVGRNTSINAFLNGLASTSAELKSAGASQPSGRSITLTLVQAGIGVTWH